MNTFFLSVCGITIVFITLIGIILAIWASDNICLKEGVRNEAEHLLYEKLGTLAYYLIELPSRMCVGEVHPRVLPFFLLSLILSFFINISGLSILLIVYSSADITEENNILTFLTIVFFLYSSVQLWISNLLSNCLFEQLNRIRIKSISELVSAFSRGFS